MCVPLNSVVYVFTLHTKWRNRCGGQSSGPSSACLLGIRFWAGSIYSVECYCCNRLRVVCDCDHYGWVRMDTKVKRYTNLMYNAKGLLTPRSSLRRRTPLNNGHFSASRRKNNRVRLTPPSMLDVYVIILCTHHGHIFIIHG